MRRVKKLPSLKSLQTIWYAKLKKAGFEDIEKTSGAFKRTSAQLQFYGNEITWKAKHDYYYAANQFLHNYKFSSNLERIIWEYHSNGISNRNIVNLLTKTKIKSDRETVRRVIKQLATIMKRVYFATTE